MVLAPTLPLPTSEIAWNGGGANLFFSASFRLLFLACFLSSYARFRPSPMKKIRRLYSSSSSERERAPYRDCPIEQPTERPRTTHPTRVSGRLPILNLHLRERKRNGGCPSTPSPSIHVAEGQAGKHGWDGTRRRRHRNSRIA